MLARIVHCTMRSRRPRRPASPLYIIRRMSNLRGGFKARVGIADGDPASMAKAMDQALDDAVAQVAAVSLSMQRHRASFPR